MRRWRQRRRPNGRAEPDEVRSKQGPDATLRVNSARSQCSIRRAQRRVNPVDVHELERRAAIGEFDERNAATAWHTFGKVVLIKLPDEESLDAMKAVRGIEKRVCPLALLGRRAGTRRPLRRDSAAKRAGEERKTRERESQRKRVTKKFRSLAPIRSPAAARQLPLSPAALTAVPGAAARHFQTARAGVPDARISPGNCAMCGRSYCWPVTDRFGQSPAVIASAISTP